MQTHAFAKTLNVIIFVCLYAVSQADTERVALHHDRLVLCQEDPGSALQNGRKVRLIHKQPMRHKPTAQEIAAVLAHKHR